MESVKVGYSEKVILNQVKLNLVPALELTAGQKWSGQSTLIKLLSEQLVPISGEYHTLRA